VEKAALNFVLLAGSRLLTLWATSVLFLKLAKVDTREYSPNVITLHHTKAVLQLTTYVHT
jgi:hypothetical protein